MTPSDSPLDAAETLESVLTLLGETHIQRVVDLPVDRAAATYHPPDADPASLAFSVFLDRPSSFVAHLYREAMVPPRILTSAQARTEALNLLETFYDGRAGRGPESAYVDCMAGGEIGMEMLLLQMAWAVKASQRRSYIQWVLTKHLRSKGWRFKRDLVAVCIERFAEVFPEEIRLGPPERFVPQCEALIHAIVTTSNDLRTVLGGS